MRHTGVGDGLREARTYKRFLTLESPQGPVVQMEGRGDVVKPHRVEIGKA